MAVKVFIKRLVPQDKAKAMIPLFRQMRASATAQPGYISGETLVSHDDPQDVLVIGTWQDMESWLAWRGNQRRIEFETMLAMYQEGPTHYEAYVLGVPPQP